MPNHSTKSSNSETEFVVIPNRRPIALPKSFMKWEDLKHKNSAARRQANRQEAKAELERIGFGKLRQARQLTQVELAERLDVPQAAISRMERRADLLLSTLRQYIEAMGGELELRAVFPEGQFLVEPLAPGTKSRPLASAKNPAPKRAVRRARASTGGG